MPKVRVKYLNFYYTVTRNREEYIEFEESFTLGQLLNTLTERYGREFSKTVSNHKNTLRPYTRIIVNGRVANNLKAELQDGDTVIFSLPLSGG